MTGAWVQLLPGGGLVDGPGGRWLDADGAARARRWAETGEAEAALGLEGHDGGADPALLAGRAQADRELARWRASVPAAVAEEVLRHQAARRVFPPGPRGLLALPSSVARLAALVAQHARDVAVVDDLDETAVALRMLGVACRGLDDRPGTVPAALMHVREEVDGVEGVAAVRPRLGEGSLLFCTVAHPWHPRVAHAAYAAGLAVRACLCDFQVQTAGHAEGAPATRDLWVLAAAPPGASPPELRLHVSEHGWFDGAARLEPGQGAAVRATWRGDRAPPALPDAGLLDVRLAAGAFDAEAGERLLAGLAPGLGEVPMEVRRSGNAGRWAAACTLTDGGVVAAEYLARARRLRLAFSPYTTAVEFALLHALRCAVAPLGFAVEPPPLTTVAGAEVGA